MSANDKTTVGNGRGDWQTPPSMFNWLDRRFAFEFDLFASHENALTLRYATEHGVFDKLGGQESELDGLSCDLAGFRVFANPPYSRGVIAQACESMARRRNEAAIIVALLPAATDTRWFHDHVAPLAHIEFLKRRVHFVNPETGLPGDSPPGGHMIVIYRPDEP